VRASNDKSKSRNIRYYLNGSYMGTVDDIQASSIISRAHKEASIIMHDFPDDRNSPESIHVQTKRLT